MLQWYKIDVETDSDGFTPPFFTGSMLRGAIGRALKKVVCINPSYRCENCFAADECLFYRFYEAKNVAHPYRLGISLKPDKPDFSFYLFEDATRSLPYVLSAIHKALEEVGLTRERKRVKIARILVDGSVVYDGHQFLPLQAIKPKAFVIDTFCTDVRIQFTMPLRIKEHNRFAREGVSLHTLVGNIHGRYRQLRGEPPAKLGYRVRGEVRDPSLTFVEMRRYSNRQRSGMNMGGIKGSMDIYGLDKQSYAYLKLGEIIGAGKQTVFGLGSYVLKPIEEGR